MKFISSLGRALVCILFWVSLWVLSFIACGIIGSIFTGDSSDTIGPIWGFVLIFVPPTISTISTIWFAQKWDRVRLKKAALRLASIDKATTHHEFSQSAGFESGPEALDLMEGHEFEYWCAEALRNKGFVDVQVTPGSGDQGVDIIATKDGVKYAVQCKRYSSNLGNSPVQEVCAGKILYQCQVGAVITNRYFTQSARELAEATGTLLWDRDWIADCLRSVNSDGARTVRPSAVAASCSRSPKARAPHLLYDAIEVLLETEQASVSMLQRKLNLDYTRAAGLMDELENRGIVGPSTAGKPRRILIARKQWDEMKAAAERNSR